MLLEESFSPLRSNALHLAQEEGPHWSSPGNDNNKKLKLFMIFLFGNPTGRHLPHLPSQQHPLPLWRGHRVLRRALLPGGRGHQRVVRAGAVHRRELRTQDGEKTMIVR